MVRGEPDAPGRRRLFRGAAMAVAAFAASLLAVEGVARIVLGERFAPGIVTDVPMSACVVEDPRLGWRCRPNLRARVVGPSLECPVFRYSFATNRRGLRDADHPYERTEGTIRIACLGDSFAWGWGVDDGEAFPDRLEALLSPSVEVVSLGVPGYSTDQELLHFLEEGRRYRPDLVLLAYVLNDAEGNLLPVNYGLRKPVLARAEGGWRFALPGVGGSNSSPGGWKLWLSSRSALFQAVRAPVVSGEVSCGALRGVPREELARAFRETEYPVYSPREIDSRTRAVSDEASPTYALLARLRAACDEAGARLLAFTLPHLHDQYLQVPRLPSSAKAKAAIRSGVPFETDLTERLREAGSRIGFQTLSVDHALLDATRRGRNLNVGDGHLNSEGHAVVAEDLARKLRPILGEILKGSPLSRAPDQRGARTRSSTQ
jgi:lysophospholipase L1-like esterase